MQCQSCCTAQRIQLGRRLQASGEHLGISRAHAQVRAPKDLQEARGVCLVLIRECFEVVIDRHTSASPMQGELSRHRLGGETVRLPCAHDMVTCGCRPVRWCQLNQAAREPSARLWTCRAGSKAWLCCSRSSPLGRQLQRASAHPGHAGLSEYREGCQHKRRRLASCGSHGASA